jgi:hypothetical protein
MSDSLLGKLKNKINYKINAVVEDPEAQKFAEEREKKAEEKSIEPPRAPNTDQERIVAFIKDNNEEIANQIMPKLEEYFKRYGERPNMSAEKVRQEKERFNEVMKREILKSQSMEELSWKVDDEIERAESENPDAFQPKNIPKQVWRNAKRYLPMLIKPVICLLLASLVANESIVYPPQVRLAFFIVTLVACLLSSGVMTMMIVFYIGKRIYDYYINEMSENPKRLIMPTLFALLPLMPNDHPNRVINGLTKTMKYGDKYKPGRGHDAEIQKRMEMYQEQLDESFPYLQVIKTKDPFKGRLDKIQTNFERLHQAVAPSRFIEGESFSVPAPSAPPSVSVPAPPAPSAPSAPPSVSVPAPPVLYAPGPAPVPAPSVPVLYAPGPAPPVVEQKEPEAPEEPPKAPEAPEEPPKAPEAPEEPPKAPETASVIPPK